jgi:hypothetical protein
MDTGKRTGSPLVRDKYQFMSRVHTMCSSQYVGSCRKFQDFLQYEISQTPILILTIW